MEFDQEEPAKPGDKNHNQGKEQKWIVISFSAFCVVILLVCVILIIITTVRRQRAREGQINQTRTEEEIGRHSRRNKRRSGRDASPDKDNSGGRRNGSGRRVKDARRVKDDPYTFLGPLSTVSERSDYLEASATQQSSAPHSRPYTNRHSR